MLHCHGSDRGLVIRHVLEFARGQDGGKLMLGRWGPMERKTGPKSPELCRFRDRPASGDIQGVGRIAEGSKLAPHHEVRNREGIAPAYGAPQPRRVYGVIKTR